MILDYSKLGKKINILSLLLVIWVYINAFFYFIPLIFPANTMLLYFSLLLITGAILLKTRRIDARLLIFSLLYIIVALVNIQMVSYQYYAAIEAFSGMAYFMPALMIISSSKFDFYSFTEHWFWTAVLLTLFSPIAVLLMQKELVEYAVFTYINLPNAIISSYFMLVSERKNRRWYVSIALVIINFLVILAFGGRMAAGAAAFTGLCGYFLSKKIGIIKKSVILLTALTFIYLIIQYLYEIVLFLRKIFVKLNLQSRSLAIMIWQFKPSTTGLYMTGRNVIYKEVLDYIVERLGMPGGFGVSLYLTDGKYYHPHNLFLQLTVLFGIFGAITVVLLVIWKVVNVRKIFEYKVFQFVFLLLLDYLLISFTGGSILNHYVAILCLGMLFLYRSKV